MAMRLRQSLAVDWPSRGSARLEREPNPTAGVALRGLAISGLLAQPLSTFARPAVIATTGEGVIVHWNAGAERIYGWRRSEVMLRNILDVLPARYSRGQLAQIVALLQAGLPWTGSLTLQRHTRLPLNVFVMDFPVGDVAHGSGAIVGVSVPNVQRRLIERDAPRIMAELHLRAARLATNPFHGPAGAVRRPLAPQTPPSLSITRLAALHLKQPFARDNLWRQMQRIETYRHRAERLAAAGAPVHSVERQRAQMWLRLADRLMAARR